MWKTDPIVTKKPHTLWSDKYKQVIQHFLYSFTACDLRLVKWAPYWWEKIRTPPNPCDAYNLPKLSDNSEFLWNLLYDKRWESSQHSPSEGVALLEDHKKPTDLVLLQSVIFHKSTAINWLGEPTQRPNFTNSQQQIILAWQSSLLHHVRLNTCIIIHGCHSKFIKMADWMSLPSKLSQNRFTHLLFKLETIIEM